MQYQKSLQRLWSISLSFNHIDNFLLKLLTLSVSTGPTVTSSTSFFWYENVFRIVQIWVSACLNCIYDLFYINKLLLVPNRSRLILEHNGHRQLDRKRHLFCLLLEHLKYTPPKYLKDWYHVLCRVVSKTQIRLGYRINYFGYHIDRWRLLLFILAFSLNFNLKWFSNCL